MCVRVGEREKGQTGRKAATHPFKKLELMQLSKSLSFFLSLYLYTPPHNVNLSLSLSHTFYLTNVETLTHVVGWTHTTLLYMLFLALPI